MAKEPPRGSYAIKYVCMCVWVSVCMCMYVCVYVCVYVCMYVCMYVCKSCSIDGKCPDFSLRLYLQMRRELMLANFGLKIRPF